MSEAENPTTPPPDPQDRSTTPPPDPQDRPIDQEQVARELAEELRKLKVEDVLVSVLIQISSIGYLRLGLTAETKEERDLEQTRLAVETMRALTPVLQNAVPAELIRDFNQSVANLQLAYAKAASEGEAGEGDGRS